MIVSPVVILGKSDTKSDESCAAQKDTAADVQQPLIFLTLLQQFAVQKSSDKNGDQAGLGTQANADNLLGDAGSAENVVDGTVPKSEDAPGSIQGGSTFVSAQNPLLTLMQSKLAGIRLSGNFGQSMQQEISVGLPFIPGNSSNLCDMRNSSEKGTANGMPLGVETPDSKDTAQSSENITSVATKLQSTINIQSVLNDLPSGDLNIQSAAHEAGKGLPNSKTQSEIQKGQKADQTLSVNSTNNEMAAQSAMANIALMPQAAIISPATTKSIKGNKDANAAVSDVKSGKVTLTGAQNTGGQNIVDAIQPNKNQSAQDQNPLNDDKKKSATKPEAPVIAKQQESGLNNSNAVPDATLSATQEKPADVQLKASISSGDERASTLTASIGKIHGESALDTLRMSQAGNQQPAAANDANAIITKMAEVITLQIQAKTSQVKVMLQPESLGEVMVKIKVTDGKMHAEIDVSNPTTKVTLETNINQLRENLNMRGLEVNKIDIIASAQFGLGNSDAKGKNTTKGGKTQYAVDADVEQDQNEQTQRDLGYNTMELTI